MKARCTTFPSGARWVLAYIVAPFLFVLLTSCGSASPLPEDLARLRILAKTPATWGEAAEIVGDSWGSYEDELSRMIVSSDATLRDFATDLVYTHHPSGKAILQGHELRLMRQVARIMQRPIPGERKFQAVLGLLQRAPPLWAHEGRPARLPGLESAHRALRDIASEKPGVVKSAFVIPDPFILREAVRLVRELRLKRYVPELAQIVAGNHGWVRSSDSCRTNELVGLSYVAFLALAHLHDAQACSVEVLEQLDRARVGKLQLKKARLREAANLMAATAPEVAFVFPLEDPGLKDKRITYYEMEESRGATAGQVLRALGNAVSVRYVIAGNRVLICSHRLSLYLRAVLSICASEGDGLSASAFRGVLSRLVVPEDLAQSEGADSWKSAGAKYRQFVEGNLRGARLDPRSGLLKVVTQ